MARSDIAHKYFCIRKTLDGLPKLEDEIVDLLKKGGYKGYRRAVNSCPVAKYIIDKCDVIPSVSGSDINIGTRLHFEVPDAVTDFIHSFDSNCYPELERK